MSAMLDQPILLLLAAGIGAGVFLIVAVQPLGRPHPDLFVRVRELDPQYWPTRLDASTATSPGWFGIPVIDALLQPLVDEAAAQVG